MKETLVKILCVVFLGVAAASATAQQTEPNLPYRVQDAKLYGYIDGTGRVVIPISFQKAGEFSEGLAAVSVESAQSGYGKWGYVNQEGKFIVPPQYKRASDFSEGRAAVCMELCGYIDRTGKLAIPLQYALADDFHEELAAVLDKRGLYGYIDRGGALAIPYQFTRADGFSQGLAAAAFEGPSDPVLEIIAKDHGAAVPWAAGHKNVGFIDRTGKMTIPAQFDDAKGFSGGLAPVCLDRKWGAVYTSGKLAITPDWGKMEEFSGGLAAAAWIATDGLGKPLEDKDTGGLFDAPAFQLGGWTFLTPLGQPVADKANSLREAGSYHEGLAAVRGRFDGYMDQTGNMVIRIPGVLSLGPFRGGLATVCNIPSPLEGTLPTPQCAVIDKLGHPIWRASTFF